MKTLGIIPARYESKRFPGKPLIDIDGKSMIERVYRQALKATSLTDVVVATDDQRIADHVEGFGGKVAMTANHHQSGTERCAEAVLVWGKEPDVVINIQGDEPYIHPQQIDEVARLFDSSGTGIATLAKKISSSDELFDPNRPKVVFDRDQRALYFSRSPIPYCREADKEKWLSSNTYYKHIGIYGYRTQVLQEIVQLQPGKLETSESLEQLRWLENGHRIMVGITGLESAAIDTPDDLEKLSGS